MTTKIESYTTDERLEQILRLNGVSGNIKSVEKIIPKMSDDFTADYEIDNINFSDDRPPLELFIKKFIPDNEDSGGIRDMELFEKEANFFNFLLPQLNKLCVEKFGSNNSLNEIIPKSYYADENVIIMDNLKSRGFLMLKEQETHTMSQARTVIEILAKIHAASYALIQSMGSDKFLEKFPFTKVATRWSSVGLDSSKPWLDRLINGALHILKLYPVKGSQGLVDHLSSYGTEAYEKLGGLFDLSSSLKRHCGLVLNHGDVWNCNLLFNQSSDCVLIDFQTIHVGSPALDLMYYVYVTVKGEVRRDEWKRLLEIYYNIFTSHAHCFGARVEFSLDDLVRDYVTFSEIGFLFALDPVYFFTWGESVETSEYIEKIVNTERGEFFATEIVGEFEEYQKMTN